MSVVPSCPQDPDFYRKFVLTLDASKDHELALLAATLTMRTKGQSIPQALDQAILIREESIAARTRRREALVKAAPWEALNHARSWRIEEAPEFINDPVFHQLGDVIKQKLLEIYGEGDARRAAETRERIGLAMEKCKTRDGRPAPSLPATAKEVLLWVANAPPEHWPAVEAAFLDFLTLCGCRTNHDLNDQRANAEERAKMRADFLNSHGSLEALTKEMRSRLEGYAADATDVDFCDNFAPGKKASPRTRKTAETTYREHNQTYDKTASIHWLAADFTPFWDEHKMHYLRPLEKKAALSLERSQAGKRGRAAQARSRWMNKTRAFLEHAINVNLPLAKALEKYIPQNQSSDTAAKTRHFLGTLFNENNRNLAAWEIVKLLRGDDGLSEQKAETMRKDNRAIPLNARVNNADEETVNACLELIRSHDNI